MADVLREEVVEPVDVGPTVATILATQLDSGMIPWFAGGHADPWNHVEAAMALCSAGELAAAGAALEWLAHTQSPDGSWHARYSGDGCVEERRIDTNGVAYVATGVLGYLLAGGDAGFAGEMFAVVERALGFVVAATAPSGAIPWSIDPGGRPAAFSLLAASSSIYQSLSSGVRLAASLGLERPGWEAAAARVGRLVAGRETYFADNSQFAMDWYYPALVGALEPETAAGRIDERWSEFVIGGRGVRCVSHRPWVTAAETAECAIALASIGRRDEAVDLLAWARQHRLPDGSYVTGLVYPQGSSYPPAERSSYTAAAIVLAEDALSGLSPAAQLFVDGSLPRGLDLDPTDAPASRLSTRRLPVPAEASSTNSPSLSARL